MHARVLALLVLLAAVGCTSHYLPQTPGKVAVMIHDGGLAYARDGRFYAHGVFGHGLEEAVAGNPAATAVAQEYSSRMTTGFVATLIGAAGVVAGSAWAGYAASRDEDLRGVGVPLATAVVGAFVMLAGAIYAASAEPYRWDAINMFNDEAAPPALPLPGAPGYGPSARGSLTMGD
jgi:hypothetical protein